MKAMGNRPCAAGSLHNRERNDDGTGPGGHLVEDVTRQQHQLRRNRRYVGARIEPEEAEVDLDVAIGALNSTQREDAVAEPLHAVRFRRHTAELQCGVRFDGRADLGRTARVDIEAAVGKLVPQDRAASLLNAGPGRRTPQPVLRRMQPELDQHVIGLEGRIRE